MTTLRHRVFAVTLLASLACGPSQARGDSAALADRAALDLSSFFGAVGRGTDGGPTCPIGWSTLETGFESLAVLPANLVNQLDTVTWGGAAAGCVTGRGHFSAPGGFTPLAPPEYGAVADPIGGNATTKLRGFVQTSRAPGQGFRWARYNFLRTNTASPTQQGAERFGFGPTLSSNVRVGHDAFLTAASSGWATVVSDEAISHVSAIFMGGFRNGEPWPYFWMDCVQDGCSAASPEFYRSGAPFPGGAGQNVPAPIGGWFRVIFEATASGRVLCVVDLLDGHGEFVIFDYNGSIGGTFGHSNRVDQVTWTGGYETAGDAMYADNLRAEGVRHCRNCPGDATRDCIADFADLNLVLSQFGASTAPSPEINGDVNRDGVVNFTDLNLVLGNFGNGC